ncbi:Virginiamycin B lyase protein [Nitrosopumilaceae archaeon]|nr:lyase [Nitrosopumilus sp.]CAI9831150.1 Virginiamycin B lyase protein [Nitrosopumilaceae archaeon]MDA7945216.1 lyase [Nitrosopumilus sp.]MDA7954999.1 lyase [Nitrosopumilus sp.]MDA7973841.1 lyase [Nitrosopumilus sp.]
MRKDRPKRKGPFMKKQTKGIVMFAFLGGIMATSGVVIGIPGTQPEQGPMQASADPSEYYPVEERPRFCGTDEASSTPYVTEYEIPTPCTNPVGIAVDGDGAVWFAQANTGSLGRFDPSNGTFTQLTNPSWQAGSATNSMMWGAAAAPDGSVWYTEDRFNSIWRYSASDDQYTRFALANPGQNLLPQKIAFAGSQIIVNDFLRELPAGDTSARSGLILFDPAQDPLSVSYVTVPPPNSFGLTSGFAIDGSLIWYTNWDGVSPGFLVRFDRDAYESAGAAAGETVDTVRFTSSYNLPDGLLNPNGITQAAGRLWMADTASSYFFSFDPVTEQFTRYVTSVPRPDAYGNHTGVVLDPQSRPYWMVSDGQDRVAFNEQTGNAIGLFDPATEALVEYRVPSSNPFWSDCEPATGLPIEDCGLAQVLDIAADGDRIWFTEWVENALGMVDTSAPLPFGISLDASSVEAVPGGSASVSYAVPPSAEPVASSAHEGIGVALGMEGGAARASVTVGPGVQPGEYKVLLGARDADVTISRYLTVVVR